MCDGGSDHNLTHASVQASLSALFIKSGVDQLIAVRTAPGHSFRNMVEHVMSAVNLGLQNSAFMRTPMGEDFEAVVMGCGCMADVRVKLAEVEGLQEAWVDSMQGPIAAVAERISQVDWTGNKVRGRWQEFVHWTKSTARYF